jgi:acyl carrier protein
MEQNEMFLVVKDCLIETLGIDKESITMDSSLYDDLGAESIDMLDVSFRIEKKTKVRISMGDIQKLLQGEIPEEDFFDENGAVTSVGLEHLQKIFPDITKMAGELDQQKLFSLFTVGHLVNMIADRVPA